MCTVTRFLIGLTIASGWLLAADAIAATPEELAQRFRPYYKFSLESEGRAEECRPCAWEWFVQHADLYRGDQRLMTSPQLAGNPAQILAVAEADLRASRDKTCPFLLRPDKTGQAGQDWGEVMEAGAGLYAQYEEVGPQLVVLTYWTLFGFNRTTVSGDHEGDLTAVSVVYDRGTDRLVRVAYGIHGSILESFDLGGGAGLLITELSGVDPANRPARVVAQYRPIADGLRFQDGPAYHSPSRPAIYLSQDPDSKRFEHPVVFHEWGAHEPWPNAGGSVTTAPKHGGDGVSFLPKCVRFIGSVSAPVKKEEPFMFFNGKWGNDPKGLAFHRACYYPEGRARNRLGIPANAFVDRELLTEGPLGWPPPPRAGIMEYLIEVKANKHFIEFKAESNAVRQKATGHLTANGAYAGAWNMGAPSAKNPTWFWWDTLNGTAEFSLAVDGTVLFKGTCSHNGDGEIRVRNTCATPAIYITTGSPRIVEGANSKTSQVGR